MWDHLDDSLGEESKFCLLIRDGVVEGNGAFFTTKMHLVKNSLANVAELEGCPRRRNPWVSSTGIAGAVMSVGWGVVKNVAILLAIDRPSLGLEAEMRGSGDMLLQEVRILVFVMFTKQLRAASLVLSVLQKNSRLGRFIQVDMLST